MSGCPAATSRGSGDRCGCPRSGTSRRPRASRRAARACGAADPWRRSAPAHSGDEETTESALPVWDAERGVARPASSRAQSTSRCRTGSTESCDATASTASLTAFSGGLSGSDIPVTIDLRHARSGSGPSSDLRVRDRGNGDRDHQAVMFGSIVVGTDGSDTATTAVRYAVDLARELGARLQIVSAYEPVPDQRLRSERSRVPSDLQWIVNPREDVLVMLEDPAGRPSTRAFRRSRPSPARATPPTRSSTWPRSSAPI